MGPFVPLPGLLVTFALRFQEAGWVPSLPYSVALWPLCNKLFRFTSECDTYWPLDGQHGSQTFFIHLLFQSFLGLEPQSQCTADTHSNRSSHFGSARIFFTAQDIELQLNFYLWRCALQAAWVKYTIPFAHHFIYFFTAQDIKHFESTYFLRKKWNSICE